MIDLRKKKDLTAEVFTASLNDIMFFLMLFFILISTLLNPSMIRVSLPSSQSSQTIQKKEINLTMTLDKNYFVNNTQVQYDQLEAELKKELTRSPEAFVMLRFDATLHPGSGKCTLNREQVKLKDDYCHCQGEIASKSRSKGN